MTDSISSQSFKDMMFLVVFFFLTIIHSSHANITLIIRHSSAFRVNHLHYQPHEYEEDPELVGYEDADYDNDYHSDSR